jgi:hypothetical protein
MSSGDALLNKALAEIGIGPSVSLKISQTARLLLL